MNSTGRRLILTYIHKSRLLLPQVNSFIKSRGIDILRDPYWNRESSFTLKERQLLGIHGLLPPAVNTLEEQAIRVMINLRKSETDLNRYILLSALQERNETLFYKVINDNIEYCMPLIYTPTVGTACQKYGLMVTRQSGLYITIHDKMHISRMLNNWPQPQVKAIVVTDGERILGLGDLGSNGMGIPIGKLSLYTALAGVPPKYTLPVMLDVGTNNHELLDDPLYMGLRHSRIRGEAYDRFMDQFISCVTQKYGPDTLIQFEDFGNVNAYRMLNKYKDQYCVFNDDIQGTASVCLAGILGASRISKRPLKENRFLFFGAGSAATGIAHLIVDALLMEGCTREEAMSKIFMFDVKGLLTKDRHDEHISDNNKEFCQDIPQVSTLLEAVQTIRPTAIIGVSGVPKAFTPEIINELNMNVRIPYIFALSNPTSKAECTAEDAYSICKDNCVFACGSPFAPIEIDGKTYFPSQCNNSYIFPGVALAIVVFKIRPVTQDVFLTAAQTLATLLAEDEIDCGKIFPDLSSIREVSISIAIKVAKQAYRIGTAGLFPEPTPKYDFIRGYWYTPEYTQSLPKLYRYRAMEIVQRK